MSSSTRSSSPSCSLSFHSSSLVFRILWRNKSIICEPSSCKVETLTMERFLLSIDSWVSLLEIISVPSVFSFSFSYGTSIGFYFDLEEVPGILFPFKNLWHKLINENVEGREKGTEDKRLKVGDTFQELIQILKEKRREPKILREEHKKDNLPIAWSWQEKDKGKPKKSTTRSSWKVVKQNKSKKCLNVSKKRELQNGIKISTKIT